MLTGPNIFISICLSKMRRFFSSFAVKVQDSDEHVTTGLIVVLLPAFIPLNMFFAVSTFWRLVAGLSPLRAEFDARKVHERCVVYKVAPRQVSVRACWLYPVNITPPMLCAHKFVNHTPT